jgi:hypothetical protein
MNRLWTICSGSMPVPQPIVADSPADGHGAADLAIEAAAAHRSEQPRVERLLLDQALHARGAVRQDRFRARLRGDGVPP